MYRNPAFAIRSRDGVGMTPPKVPGTPKPWSSVMMRSTFGAPLGGTTRGGHQGVESVAASLITPPNFGAGAGSCLPSTVVVALAEPSWPVTCWAETTEIVPCNNNAKRYKKLFSLKLDLPTPGEEFIHYSLACDYLRYGFNVVGFKTIPKPWLQCSTRAAIPESSLIFSFQTSG